MRPTHLLRPWLAVIVAFAIGAPSSPSAADPQAPKAPEDTPAVPEPSDYHAPNPMPVPPGAKADQALWTKAMDASNALALSRADAAKLQWKAHNGKYDVRLAERAKGLPAEEAKRLQDLAKGVQTSWSANHELTTSPWPVDPTRGCQYQAQMLESAMHMSEGAEKSAQLVPARADVTRCIDAAGAILKRMGRSNQELEKALTAADAALATVPAAKPAAAPAAK